MAVPPDSTRQALLREVDEELRREQVANVWSRYGVLIIIGIVAVLAAFGGALWYRHHVEAVRGAEGEKLQAAFDMLGNGDTKAAAAALQPLTDAGSAGYRALAKMAQADIRLQANDTKGASALFAQVAADDSAGQPLRDLALLRQTAADYDTLKPDVVVSRLKPLAVKGNPYFGSAGEMIAIAYLRMNRRDLAGALYQQIAASDDVPATLRQRAVQMASTLTTQTATNNSGTQNKDKPAT